jgi:hypothetical protein
MPTSYSYPGLSEQAKTQIKNMIDLGIIQLEGIPKRNEASVVQNFIRDYLEEHNSSK